jgi:hypothetical protein
MLVSKWITNIFVHFQKKPEHPFRKEMNLNIVECRSNELFQKQQSSMLLTFSFFEYQEVNDKCHWEYKWNKNKKG